jgi:uncharacterized membrane protein (DUF106 family)
MGIPTGLFVLSLVAVVVLGPILIGVIYSLLKHRAISKQELKALQNDIAHIRVDIEEIKEQFADFIIKTH